MKSQQKLAVFIFLLFLFTLHGFISVFGETSASTDSPVNIVRVNSHSIIISLNTSSGDFNFIDISVVQGNLTVTSYKISLLERELFHNYPSQILGWVFYKENSTWGSAHYVPRNNSLFVVPKTSVSLIVNITGLRSASDYSLIVKLYEASFSLNDSSLRVQVFSIVDSFHLSSIKTKVEFENAKDISSINAVLFGFMPSFMFYLVILAFFLYKNNRNIGASILVLPLLLLLFLMDVYPIIYGVYLSFTRFSMGYGEIPRYIGFENFSLILSNNLISIVFVTTIVWAFLAALVHMIIGLVIAYAIWKIRIGKKFFMLLVMLPWLIPGYILINAWRSIIWGLSGDSLAKVLFGFTPAIRTDPYQAFLTTIFVEAVTGSSFLILAIYSILITVPKEHIELAKIDGLPEHVILKEVIWPYIKPAIMPLLVLDLLKMLSGFEVAFFITAGEPILNYGISEYGVVGATTTFSIFIFRAFYQWREIGLASAYSIFGSIVNLIFYTIWLVFFKPLKRSPYKGNGKELFLYASLGLLFGIGPFLSGRYFDVLALPGLHAILIFLSMLLIFSKSRNWEIDTILTDLLFIIHFVAILYQLTVYELWFAFDFTFIGTFIAFLYNRAKVLQPINISHYFLNAVNVMNDIDFLITISTGILISLPIIFGLNLLISLASLVGWFSYILGKRIKHLLIISVLSYGVVAFSSMFIQGYLFRFTLCLVAVLLSLVNIVILIDSRRFLAKILHSIGYLTLSYYSFFIILPLWVIVWISLDPLERLVPTGVIPPYPSFIHFQEVLNDGFALNILNSIIISSLSILIGLPLGLVSAFVIHEIRIKGGERILDAFVITKIFTGIVTLAPLFVMLFYLGLIDSYLGVALVMVMHTSIYTLYFTLGFLKSIPKELNDSAKIDGLNGLSILVNLDFPLMISGIIFVVINLFISTWQSFLLPYVLLFNPSFYPVSVKLYQYLGEPGSTLSHWGLFAAGSIISMLPLFVLYLLISDRLIWGFRLRRGENEKW